MKQYITILFAAIVALISSCGRCEKGGRTDHWYDLPVNITPSKDTFSIGDTIWIENSFNDVLLNKNYNKTYTIKDFDFKSNMVIKDLNTPKYATSYKDPKLITIEGTTTGANIGTVDYQVLYIGYDYANNQYKYKVAFVVDKPGFYYLGFFSYRTGVNRDDIDITECPSENMKVTYKTNNHGDNNYEMVKNAVDPTFSVLSKEEFDENGGYCFYIR